MLEEISLKILERLNNCGIDTKQIDFKTILDRRVGSLQKPAVNIGIDTATFKKITQQTSIEEFPIVSLLLIVQECKSEEKRRFKIYSLIQSIIECLVFQDLGLCVQTQLSPIGFNNVTDSTFSDGGMILYEINFQVSFVVKKSTKGETADQRLLSIVNDYYLQDPDDGIKDLSGVVNLVTYDGGDPYTRNYISTIDGGSANTKKFNFTIDGGFAAN